ncbi:hypothetical protein FNH22_18625 [Fulvivirga sp. M361]|uniref:hypothetical protein n=1 Tax=Fulvivirga sp. M361 TaxID=2594266 RepID=UPI00117B3067|nr:hypothetical protein [Fulvivirga sp. M361]TRX54778.1 hypothetical protein FNH22_18625 [Fulvivirga sp. M361]
MQSLKNKESISFKWVYATYSAVLLIIVIFFIGLKHIYFYEEIDCKVKMNSTGYVSIETDEYLMENMILSLKDMESQLEFNVKEKKGDNYLLVNKSGILISADRSYSCFVKRSLLEWLKTVIE